MAEIVTVALGVHIDVVVAAIAIMHRLSRDDLGIEVTRIGNLCLWFAKYPLAEPSLAVLLALSHGGDKENGATAEHHVAIQGSTAPAAFKLTSVSCAEVEHRGWCIRGQEGLRA